LATNTEVKTEATHGRRSERGANFKATWYLWKRLQPGPGGKRRNERRMRGGREGFRIPPRDALPPRALSLSRKCRRGKEALKGKYPFTTFPLQLSVLSAGLKADLLVNSKGLSLGPLTHPIMVPI